MGSEWGGLQVGMALRDMWTLCSASRFPHSQAPVSGRRRGVAGKGEGQGLLRCFLAVRVWASTSSHDLSFLFWNGDCDLPGEGLCQCPHGGLEHVWIKQAGIWRVTLPLLLRPGSPGQAHTSFCHMSCIQGVSLRVAMRLKQPAVCPGLVVWYGKCLLKSHTDSHHHYHRRGAGLGHMA